MVSLLGDSFDFSETLRESHLSHFPDRLFILTLFLIGFSGCDQPEAKGKRVILPHPNTKSDSKKTLDPKDLLPAVVLQTIQQRFPDAKIESFEIGEENRQEVYEIQLEQNDLRIDVTVSTNGQLMWIESELAFENLPQPVQETVTRRYAKHEVLHSEAVIKVANGKEVLDHYDILLGSPDNKWIGVEIFPNGRVKKTEDRTLWKD